MDTFLNKVIVLFVIGASFFPRGFCQEEEGQCKIFKTPVSIDPKQLVGDWFETHSTESRDCVHLHISPLRADKSFGWQMHWKDVTNEQNFVYVGRAAQFEDEPYKFDVSPIGPRETNFTISIAGVQYTEFLLLFHCENLNSTHFSESVDIFSRTTTLDKSAETAINIFSNMTKLNIIDQTDMSCSKSSTWKIFNISFILFITIGVSKLWL